MKESSRKGRTRQRFRQGLVPREFHQRVSEAATRHVKQNYTDVTNSGIKKYRAS